LLIEWLGLIDISADQTRLVLDRASQLAKLLVEGTPVERISVVSI
jgi:hypothetical protein